MEIFINILNENCRNKNQIFFCEWKINDIENDHHRNYCSNAYTTFELCSNCQDTLELIKKIQCNGELSILINIISQQNEEIIKMKCDIRELKKILSEITKTHIK